MLFPLSADHTSPSPASGLQRTWWLSKLHLWELLKLVCASTARENKWSISERQQHGPASRKTFKSSGANTRISQFGCNHPLNCSFFRFTCPTRCCKASLQRERSKSQRKRRKKKEKKKACGFSSVFAKMKTRHFAASGCKAPEIFFFFSDAMPLQKLQAAVFFKSNEGFDVICWSLWCSARASSNHLYCNVPVTWPKKCLFVLFVFEKEEMDLVFAGCPRCLSCHGDLRGHSRQQNVWAVQSYISTRLWASYRFRGAFERARKQGYKYEGTLMRRFKAENLGPGG